MSLVNDILIKGKVIEDISNSVIEPIKWFENITLFDTDKSAVFIHSVCLRFSLVCFFFFFGKKRFAKKMFLFVCVFHTKYPTTIKL